MKRIFFVISVLTAMAVPAFADSTPVELAIATSLGFSHTTEIAPPNMQTMFGLGIGSSPDCAITVTEGVIGDFRCPALGSMAAMFTDAVDGMVYQFVGGRTGTNESATFGGLLTGRTIDYIMLHIDSNEVQRDKHGTTWGPHYWWEIFGEGQPLNASVPQPVDEPAVPLLLAIGLAGVIGMKYRHRHA